MLTWIGCRNVDGLMIRDFDRKTKITLWRIKDRCLIRTGTEYSCSAGGAILRDKIL